MRAAATAATTAAATAATAARLGDVIGGRDAAELEGHADIFANFLLQTLKLLLGGEEFTGDFVIKQGLTRCFEFADFSSTEFHSGVLLVVEFLAALMHALILKPRGIIVEKTLHTFLELQKCGIAGNLGTEFASFYDDGGIFSSDRHKS